MAGWIHLLVRGIHVLGMSLLVGGAVFTWKILRWSSESYSERIDQKILDVAVGYEWVFWGAMGVMVMTGVGNLGALAPAIPRPDTVWGLTLLSKLLAVLGLVIGSLPRTILVARYRHNAVDDDWSRSLRYSYSVTALYLCGVLALAEVLAHG